LWKPDCRAGWAYLPVRDRERFIEIIHRARRHAPTDVVQFLKDALWGREKLSKEDLFGIAATNGFAKGTIRKALKSLGYRSKRRGHGVGATWYVFSLERDWKGQVPNISDAEIRAAVDAQPDPRSTRAAKSGWKRKMETKKYLEDI